MDNIFDLQLFADGDEDSGTALYDLDDLMTVEHGVKLAQRTGYLLDHKLDVVEDAQEGNVATFDSDGNIVDSGHGVASNEEFLAMLNENLPNLPKLELSATEFTLAVGESTDVTVTSLGDGEISVSGTTALEGITYEVSDTTITFSNASATEGTGVYTIDIAGTAIFNPATAVVNITGTSGS